MKTKFIVAIVLMVIGIAMTIWSINISYDLPNYREMMKIAREASKLQNIIGITCLFASYILFTIKGKSS